MKKILSILGGISLVPLSLSIQAFTNENIEKNSIYDIEYSLDYDTSKKMESYVYKKNNKGWESKESDSFFLFNLNKLNNHVIWDVLYNNKVKMTFQGYLKVRVGGTGANTEAFESGELTVTKTKDEIHGKISLYKYSQSGAATQEVGAGIEYSIDKNLDLYASTYAYAGSWWATSSCEANAFLTDIRITTILY